MRRLSLLVLLLLSIQLYGMQNSSSSSASQSLLGKVSNMFWQKKKEDTPTSYLQESKEQNEDLRMRERTTAEAQRVVHNMWYSTPCGSQRSVGYHSSLSGSTGAPDFPFP